MTDCIANQMYKRFGKLFYFVPLQLGIPVVDFQLSYLSFTLCRVSNTSRKLLEQPGKRRQVEPMTRSSQC